MRSNPTLLAGVALLALGSLGYAVGVVAAYPGRSFAVTGVMVGIALVAVGGRATGGGRGDEDGGGRP